MANIKYKPKLSKSRYTSGIQCRKRLYYEVFRRELMAEDDMAQLLLYENGNLAGEEAQRAFPGGVLVEADHMHHSDAVKHTAELMGDPEVSAIYEAGFLFDNVRVRVDVLRRVGPEEWDLIEVKSSTSRKDIQLNDVAVQMYVVEGAGVTVNRAYLMHINKTYVYDGVEYDHDELFTMVNTTDEARAMRDDVRGLVRAMHDILAADEEPRVDYGAQCSDPYPCAFAQVCIPDVAEYHVSEMPRKRAKLMDDFATRGIESIKDIPADFAGMNEIECRVRDAVQSQRTIIDDSALRDLAKVEFPVHSLDFETVSLSIPRHKGMSPYQSFPFQFSDHILNADGSIEHREYLHQGHGDPRRELAEALVDALGDKGSILHYSAYEKTIIKKLTNEFPDLSEELGNITCRLLDLLPIIRNSVYDPTFRGCFSLKYVLPGLLPHMGYDDLEVADGLAAGYVYWQTLKEGRPISEVESDRQALLEYCGMDTEGTLELFKLLRDKMSA